MHICFILETDCSHSLQMAWSGSKWKPIWQLLGQNTAYLPDHFCLKITCLKRLYCSHMGHLLRRPIFCEMVGSFISTFSMIRRYVLLHSGLNRGPLPCSVGLMDCVSPRQLSVHSSGTTHSVFWIWTSRHLTLIVKLVFHPSKVKLFYLLTPIKGTGLGLHLITPPSVRLTNP